MEKSGQRMVKLAFVTRSLYAIGLAYAETQKNISQQKFPQGVFYLPRKSSVECVRAHVYELLGGGVWLGWGFVKGSWLLYVLTTACGNLKYK